MQSGGQHRAVAWRAWMEGFTGMVYWSANSYKSDKSSPKDPIKFREVGT